MTPCMNSRAACLASAGAAEPSARLRGNVRTSRVCSNASDAVLDKELIRPRRKPADMPRFAHYRAGVKLAQQTEKCPRDPRLKFQRGWKLDKQGTELAAQSRGLAQKLLEGLSCPS